MICTGCSPAITAAFKLQRPFARSLHVLMFSSLWVYWALWLPAYSNLYPALGSYCDPWQSGMPPHVTNLRESIFQNICDKRSEIRRLRNEKNGKKRKKARKIGKTQSGHACFRDQILQNQHLQTSMFKVGSHLPEITKCTPANGWY